MSNDAHRVADDPPGPSVRSLVGLVPRALGADPVELAVELRERHGHVVRIPPLYPGMDQPVYLVTHPEDVRYVLQTHPTAFRGLDIPGAMAFSRVVRNSILTLTEDSEEASWLARLRKLSPEFKEAAIARKVPALAAETLATVAEYDAADATARASPRRRGRPRGHFGADDDPARVRGDAPGTVRLLPAMRRLSLRLLGVSLFGPDVRVHEAEVIRAVETLRRAYKRRHLDVLTGAVTKHLPERVALPSFLPDPLEQEIDLPLAGRGRGRVEEAAGTLQGVADAVVRRRERTPAAYDDALVTWMTRPDPATGEVLDAGTARQEVVGLLLAGFTTLSAALTWAVYLAARHPEVGDRIHEEAGAAAPFASLEDVRSGAAPEPDAGDALEDLAFTRRVWRETLRLYPTLPVFGRMAREPVSIRGYDLAADAPVLVSPYVTHRDPAFWADPERFDPGRFAPGRRDGRPPFAYYPFSGGPHSCLGEALATTEAVTALAALFRTHRVAFANDDGDGDPAPEVGVDSAINLQPDRELLVRFVPR